MIIDLCSRFVIEFPLAYRWVRLKPFGYPAVEFFYKEVGFSWRAFRNLGSGYTCDDSTIGPFMAITGTTTPLTAFDERGITYLAGTNAGWLPYLADKGILYVQYSTHMVSRQFGLDQDIPDDFTLILDTIISVYPILHPVPLSFGVRFLQLSLS